ncbi:MAG: peptidyl-prolyl cis-trans isomerase [Candidatus Omnitrophota bacterium]|nr:peptidyl-prolyl cis-trans isomerase [Candidatus Omnitrophota bacterium]
MKTKLLIVGCAFLVAGCTSIAYGAEKIIAIVNKEIISQRDYNDFVNFMRLQLSEEYKGEELENKIQSMKVDLLDRLIEDRLILQEAKKNNITIDESRVKGRLAEIKRRFDAESDFQQDLAKQGLVQADIENKIREQLLMFYIVEVKVRQRVVINPDEVTGFYNRNQKDFIRPEERGLQVITLENQDQAKSFHYYLKTGEKLEDLAARYPITVNGLRVVKGQELRKDIEEAVFKLYSGGISEPIKVGDKYYIFKLESVTPAKQQALSEAQDKIHAYLYETKMQEEMNKWLEELKSKSYISIKQ